MLRGSATPISYHVNISKWRRATVAAPRENHSAMQLYLSGI